MFWPKRLGSAMIARGDVELAHRILAHNLALLAVAASGFQQGKNRS